MALTRRAMLAWLGAALTGGAAAVWWRRDWIVPWAVSAGLAPAPTGTLPDTTADVLRAAVTALLQGRVDPDPYVAFFHWRAEHVPGALALYRRFGVSVDRAARRSGAHGFRDAPAAVQRRILSGMGPAGGMRRLRRIAFARDEARFARHVVREVFRRFARTDAWVLAGYDAWPGTPRGLARGGAPEQG